MLDLRDIMLNTLTHAFYAAFYLHIFNSFLKFKIFIHVEQFLALSTKETFQNKLLHGVRDFEDVMFSLSTWKPFLLHGAKNENLEVFSFKYVKTKMGRYHNCL